MRLPGGGRPPEIRWDIFWKARLRLA